MIPDIPFETALADLISRYQQGDPMVDKPTDGTEISTKEILTNGE